MNAQSLSLSFRIPLAFHCLNNEGASGNVMEPRRITILEHEYDGISGEMVRRHVLENFVRLCEERNLPLADECRGLAPERSKNLLKDWMQTEAKVNELRPEHYHNATAHLLQRCALSDLGGYLIPFESTDKVKGTLKRDSCIEFGWLITEDPAIVEFTQQVAYRADPAQNNPFTQNMRVGIYSGVFRFDLDRVGRSDWAWLANHKSRVLDEAERQKRVEALLDALEQWLLSPGGARQAGWLQHQSDLREGVFCLAKSGPAPFISPLAVRLTRMPEGAGEVETPVAYNPDFREKLRGLVAKRPDNLTCFEFTDVVQLAEAFDRVRQYLRNGAGGR